MARWAMLAGCVVLLTAVVGALSYAQQAQPDKRITIEPKYIRVEAGEVALHSEQFVGKSVEVQDRFDGPVLVRNWPRGLRRHGISPDTHAAFHTHRVTGSDMLCFVAGADRQSIQVLEGLVTESPITLVGDVLDRTGGETIFLVSRMWRGHVAPPEIEKRRLVVTLRALGEEGGQLQYTIPELDKFFTVDVPTPSGQSVKVHLKAELR